MFSCLISVSGFRGLCWFAPRYSPSCRRKRPPLEPQGHGPSSFAIPPGSPTVAKALRTGLKNSSRTRTMNEHERACRGGGFLQSKTDPWTLVPRPFETIAANGPTGGMTNRGPAVLREDHDISIEKGAREVWHHVERLPESLSCRMTRLQTGRLVRRRRHRSCSGPGHLVRRHYVSRQPGTLTEPTFFSMG